MRTEIAQEYFEEPKTKQSSRLSEFLRICKKSKQTVIGASIVAIIALLALLAPVIAPHDPIVQHPDGLVGGLPIAPFKNPNYVLGTDQMGRDVLSRLLYGARVSLAIGLSSVLVSTIIGVTLGATAGYFGGKIDMIIMRCVDIVMAFPTFLLVMATVSSLKPGFLSLLISMSIARWAGMARLVRGQTLILKEVEFVEAARALGVGDFKILVRHILVNAYAPVIVSLTMGIAGAILTEAGLSFLGFGMQPPAPSWGMMVNTGRAYMLFSPALIFVPSIAIGITTLGFSLLGDGLRDVLDPRLQK